MTELTPHLESFYWVMHNVKYIGNYNPETWMLMARQAWAERIGYA